MKPHDRLADANLDLEAPTKLTKMVTEFVAGCQPSPFTDPLVMTAILTSLNRSTGNLIGARLLTSKIEPIAKNKAIEQLAEKCAEGIRLHARRTAGLTDSGLLLSPKKDDQHG